MNSDSPVFKPELTISAFEQELLHVFASLYTKGLDPCFSGVMLAAQGRRLFGETWSGAHRVDRFHSRLYPKVNCTIGRLQSKGITERVATSKNVTWGHWSLTPLGYQLVGISPS